MKFEREAACVGSGYCVDLTVRGKEMKTWFILSLATGTRLVEGFASRQEAIEYLTSQGFKYPGDGYTAIWQERDEETNG